MKKICFSLVIIICLIFGLNARAEACEATPGCMGFIVDAACGQRYGVPQGTHYYAIGTYISICGVTNEDSVHGIYCHTCHAFLGNQIRTCNELHSVCNQSRYYICQTW